MKPTRGDRREGMEPEACESAAGRGTHGAPALATPPVQESPDGGPMGVGQPAAAGPSGESDAAYRNRWTFAANRERIRWAQSWACTVCGEWVGHWGGSAERAACTCIPLDVPLEEVRPNCFTVVRPRIGDAIRAACDRRGEGA